MADRAWIERPGVAAVMRALNNAGALPMALFVGGCVRDACLGIPFSDIDIATVHPPEDAMRLLNAVGVKTIPTGIEYGTITAVAEGEAMQVTTLRRDVETDGRRAVVAFSDDWAEDASRRDFTINTLLADEWGRIFDPLGLGLQDLKAGRVRFVGNAETRIAEDYLRILRFFRFHARYGRDEMDGAALAACRGNAANIAKLSRERITYEFMRILSMDNAANTMEIMLNNNILSDIFHQGYEKKKLEKLITLQRISGTDLPARLCVLSTFDVRHIALLETRILLTGHEKAAFRQALEGVDLVKDGSDKAMRRLVYVYGNAGALRISQLKIVRDGIQISEENMNVARTWQAPLFPVSGMDLKRLGLEEGPVMGKILKATEDWWIDQDFSPDKKACLEQASILVKNIYPGL